MTFDLEERILKLYSSNKWSEILELLNENHENSVRRKFLWAVPSLNDICWTKDVVLEKCLKGIVSIGCGSGLLEWIIQQNSDLEVIGVEVDRNWWQSNYSPPLFIEKVIFTDKNEGRIPLLQRKDYAMLFCYFNSSGAFLNYMREYEGNMVIVIGPSEGQNRHTNPMPFDYKFGDLGWRLHRVRQMKKSKDLISVFVRLRKKHVTNWYD